jgi:group I intron endonuclease
MGILTLKLRS